MNVLSVPEGWLTKAGVKNAKPIVYGTVIIVSGILLFIVVRRLRNFIGGTGTTSAKTEKEMQDELSGLNTRSATLTDGQATIIAQNLLNAMDRWGTDEQSIIDNMNQAQSAADLNLIIQKFGIKPYDGSGLADTWASKQIAAVMKNLPGWLRSELGGSSLREVKAVFDKYEVPF
jgi:hypothetical protein